MACTTHSLNLVPLLFVRKLIIQKTGKFGDIAPNSIEASRLEIPTVRKENHLLNDADFYNNFLIFFNLSDSLAKT